MAKPEFDLAVIGGGSGGLVVAAGGAALGAKVALVEKHKLGGDCLWYGCVPSKTLLKSARIAHEMRHADRWALDPAPPQPDLARVMERVAELRKREAPKKTDWLGKLAGFFQPPRTIWTTWTIWTKWAMAGAMAVLLIIAGFGVHTRRENEKRRLAEIAEGERAKEQLMLAMRIASAKLNVARVKVHETTDREGESK